MNICAKKFLFCGVLTLTALTTTAYARAIVVQSVKNHTGHEAIINFRHLNGSSNHNGICINYERESQRDETPLNIRIDRRNYEVYDTEEPCGKQNSNKRYFIIQTEGGITYGKTCLNYMKNTTVPDITYQCHDGTVDVARNYYVLNITFKKHTDNDGNTYNRPYLQRSNGEWCLEKAAIDEASNCPISF